MDPTPAQAYFNGSLSDSLGLILKSKNSPPIYGDVTNFQELKQKAILELSEMLLEMRTCEKVSVNNDCNNFKKVLTKAGELRRKIAFAAEAPDAEEYGVIRTSGEYMSTLLSTETYKETNLIIKNLVLHNLPFIKDKEKAMCSATSNSRYTFKLQKECKLMLQDPLKLFSATFDGNHNWADENMFAMQHIITHKNSILPLLYSLQNKKISKAEILADENMYVFSGRIEHKIEGKWRTLTRHFTIINCDENGEIGEREINDFQLHGIVDLLHTSYKDFQYHEDSMAQLFNQILNHATTGEKLTSAMSELEYRLHHLAYFRRGSAATNEIILEAIKLTFNLPYTLKGNLKALGEPYLSKY